MSDRERCVAALELVPESKLGYALAYIQGLIADVTANQEDIPNAETIAAMQELENGGGELWTGSTKDLFDMLDAEDEANA